MIFANKTVSEVYSYTFELLTAENDRGAVLLGGVLTDAILDQMIATRLVPLPHKKDKRRERFQYAQKIDMVYRLGLISAEMYDLLHALREARNEFAHNIVSDLQDQAVSVHIENVFESIPNFYQNFMASWIRDLKATLRGVGITDEAVLNTVSPNARVRYNNYLTVVTSLLYQDLLKIEPIPARTDI